MLKYNHPYIQVICSGCGTIDQVTTPSGKVYSPHTKWDKVNIEAFRVSIAFAESILTKHRCNSA